MGSNGTSPRMRSSAAIDLDREALGQGPGHRRRLVGDQTDPERRQPGGEDRHLEDEPPAAGEGGVALHHHLVGEDVGAADVVAAGRQAQRRDQVPDHIGQGDRLAAGRHPAGADHDRKPVDQLAQDLEAGCCRRRSRWRPAARPCRPRPAGCGRPRGGSRGGRWRPARALARGPPRYDRPAPPRSAASPGEGRGAGAVLPGEVAHARLHRVHQVIGRLALVQRRGQTVGGGQIHRSPASPVPGSSRAAGCRPAPRGRRRPAPGPDVRPMNPVAPVRSTRTLHE